MEDRKLVDNGKGGFSCPSCGKKVSSLEFRGNVTASGVCLPDGSKMRQLEIKDCFESQYFCPKCERQVYPTDC